MARYERILVLLLPLTVSLSAFPQTRLEGPADSAGDSMTEMSANLVAPLFLETAGFTSRIVMVNELNYPVTATVNLYDRRGFAIASRSVEFAAHCQRSVNVGDLLREANSVETMGSVEIVPDPAKVVSMAIAAQISITGSGGSASQHMEEEALMMGSPAAGRWRVAGSALAGQPVVAVENTAGSLRTATISCIMEKGAAMRQQVRIPPRGTALVRACSAGADAPLLEPGDALVAPAETGSAGERAEAFGLSVTGDGKPGDLAVFGFSWRRTARGAMLSSQNFLDAGASRSGNTVFTGIPVGTADLLPGSFFIPGAAVANFGLKPVNASLWFARTDGSGPPAPARLASLQVPPHSARTIVLPPLLGDSGMRNSFVVRSDAEPGTFSATLVSAGSSGFDLVEQIGKDEENRENGGGHPFTLTDPGQDAVLLLFNHTAAPRFFNVKIGSGKVLWQNAWRLAPMETQAVSIRDLIALQEKDEDGMTLPKDLTSGEISWFTANPAEGKGRLLQIDRGSQLVAGSGRVNRNFSCGYNIVLCGVYVSTSTILFPIYTFSDPLALGPLVPVLCLAYDPHACYGQSYGQGGSGYTYQWQSNNTSIATINGSNTSATAKFYGAGVGAGSATGFIRSAYCTPSNGGTPYVVRPDHLQVTGDQTGTIQSCPQTLYRSVRYQVVDVNNNPLNIPLWVGEFFMNSPVSNTCNTGQPQPTVNYPTDGAGQFWDTLQVGCNSVGGSCGFTLQHQWNWYYALSPVGTLSTLTDSIHNDQVIVNGYQGTIPNKTQFH